MASAELSPEARNAELESRLLDLLDEYGDGATKFIKKGLRRKQVERNRDAIRLEYGFVKDAIVSVFLAVSNRLSRSDVELIVATTHTELTTEEANFHAYEVLQEMERDGQLVYLGSHYKAAEWLASQQFTDEFLARNPYLNHTSRQDEHQTAHLAQLTGGNTDSLAPAEEGVGSLGNLASGETVPDSQS